MKTTKRKEFIKFLVDLGLEVETTGNRIECYCRRNFLFFVSDIVQYKSEITGELSKLKGELPYDIYRELRKYSSLYIEDRLREYDIEELRKTEKS